MFRSCPQCGDQEVEHPQEHVAAGGLSACVDRGLAGLLRTCWSLGLLTYSSCEHYLWSGRSLLEFLTADGVQDFFGRLTASQDVELRRRVLEGGDDGWTVQATLRELRVEGAQPVLRMGLQVLLPQEDIARAAKALLARPAAYAAQLEQYDDSDPDPWRKYDDMDLLAVVIAVVADNDREAWRYLRDLEVDEPDDWLQRLVSTSGFLPARDDVPPLAGLALEALVRSRQELPGWEDAEAASYRQWALSTLDWLSLAAEEWPALQDLDTRRPWEEPEDVVDASGEMRLALARYDWRLRDSMAGEDLELVLEDLWLVRWQAQAALHGLDWLEAHGCYPHADPRSPVRQREEAAALEAAGHTEGTASGHDEEAARRPWPYSTAVEVLVDGRHAVFRDLGQAGKERRVVLAEGSREELAHHAHDALALPPVLEGWACRMVLGPRRRPTRVEFLPHDGRWVVVAARELSAGDIVKLPGSVYGWQVKDVHGGDGPEEVQLELAAPGLPVFGADDPVERWVPTADAGSVATP